jgi:hypothetical protein
MPDKTNNFRVKKLFFSEEKKSKLIPALCCRTSQMLLPNITHDDVPISTYNLFASRSLIFVICQVHQSGVKHLKR